MHTYQSYSTYPEKFDRFFIDIRIPVDDNSGAATVDVGVAPSAGRRRSHAGPGIVKQQRLNDTSTRSVSYTHLTLPTIYSV